MPEDPESVAIRFGAAADSYEHYARRKAYFARDWIAGHVGELDGMPECRVLDLACGLGLNVQALVEAIPHSVIRADGVDLASAMVERARQTGKYEKLYIRDLHRELPDIPSDSYDLVVAFGFLEFLDDVYTCLSESRRALRAGGRIWASFARFEAEDEASPPRHTIIEGVTLTGYSAAEILQIMRELNVRVTALEPVVGYVTRSGFSRPYYILRGQRL